MEPDVGIQPALGGFLAQSGNSGRTGVVRREGKQDLIQLGHRFVTVVPVYHHSHVLDSSLDVRLGLPDITYLQLLACRRHDLHHSDGSHRASNRLIKPRLLVSLSSHQQPVDTVLVAVLLKELNQIEELLPLRRGCRVLDVFCALQIAHQNHISRLGSFSVTGDKVIDSSFELRAPLPYRPGNFSPCADGNPFVDRYLGKDLLPEIRFVLVHDDEW
ncbi:hypothetical protein D3C81_1305780 [compost metagenome]